MPMIICIRINDQDSVIIEATVADVQDAVVGDQCQHNDQCDALGVGRVELASDRVIAFLASHRLNTESIRNQTCVLMSITSFRCIDFDRSLTLSCGTFRQLSPDQ